MAARHMATSWRALLLRAAGIVIPSAPGLFHSPVTWLCFSQRQRRSFSMIRVNWPSGPSCSVRSATVRLAMVTLPPLPSLKTRSPDDMLWPTPARQTWPDDGAGPRPSVKLASPAEASACTPANVASTKAMVQVQRTETAQINGGRRRMENHEGHDDTRRNGWRSSCLPPSWFFMIFMVSLRCRPSYLCPSVFICG